MFLSPTEILSAKGFESFRKERAIISIFRKIGRSFEGIRAADDRKSKATRSRFRRFLVQDDPLTNTGYVPQLALSIVTNWNQRGVKGRR